MESHNVLSATHLSIGYRSRHHDISIQHDLNFQLSAGGLTCLIGANGCGKSTLLRTMAGLQPPLRGSIELSGTALDKIKAHQMAQSIGLVLTDRIQAGGLTVRQLVSLGRQPYTGFFGKLHEHDHQLVSQALQAVGLSHKAEHSMAQISDGERQKAMIAKALVQQPKVIILDEPTAFLDVVSRIEVMQLLRQLAQEEQRAIVLSTHDVEQAIALADTIWMMRPGKGLQCGKTATLLANHAMDTLFADSSALRFDYEHLRFVTRN